MKLLIKILFVSTLLMSCEINDPHYKIVDVDFKPININDSTSLNKLHISKDDADSCIVLMKFLVDQNINKAFWHSDAEPGREGIISKIRKVEIIQNGEFTDFRGFDFDPQTLILHTNSRELNEWCSFLNLNTYHNLQDIKNRINTNQEDSKGIGILSPIILSISCTLKTAPFYFKMYFENGDSLIRKIDLKKESVETVTIKNN